MQDTGFVSRVFRNRQNGELTVAVKPFFGNPFKNKEIPPAGGFDGLLAENGDFLLAENGDFLITE